MDICNIKDILEKNENVLYISDFTHCGKLYAKTLKVLKNGIKYFYYEISDTSFNKVKDKNLILLFKTLYECKSNNIIY